MSHDTQQKKCLQTDPQLVVPEPSDVSQHAVGTANVELNGGVNEMKCGYPKAK